MKTGGLLLLWITTLELTLPFRLDASFKKVCMTKTYPLNVIDDIIWHHVQENPYLIL